MGSSTPEAGVDLLRMPNTQSFSLQLGQELRFEVPTGTNEDDRVHVWNSSGNVEVFGFPLLSDRVYHFNGPASLGILCINGEQGAKLHLNGQVKEGAYVATVESSRNHIKYLNLHSYYEKLRREAYARDTFGPHVLLVGGPRSGKSSLCKTLLNYAVRSRPKQLADEQLHQQQQMVDVAPPPPQWTPLFVDLDCCKPDLSLPGTLSMTTCVTPCNPASVFADCITFSIPFGYTRPRPNNVVFYQDRVEYLGEVARAKKEKSRVAKASGMFIVACGYRSGDPVEYIIHTATAFRVTDILVMDNARLCHLLQSKYNPKSDDIGINAGGGDRRNFLLPPDIADVPKSKGVLESADADEEAKSYQLARMRTYFVGSGLENETRFPYPFDVPFADIKLCRVGVMQETVSSSMLSTDVDSGQMQKTLIEIPPNRNMVGHVFALMSAWSKEDVLKAGITAFLVVKAINMQLKTVTLSSIRPKNEVPIKTHYLFYTELEYED